MFLRFSGKLKRLVLLCLAQSVYESFVGERRKSELPRDKYERASRDKGMDEPKISLTCESCVLKSDNS